MDLDSLIENLDDIVSETLDKAAERAVEVAIENIHKVSGDLGDSLKIRRRGLRSREVVATARYGAFVENGRPAITAKGDQPLVFRVGGSLVRTRSVGPARARPFMEPASKAVQAEIAGIFESLIN